MKDSEPKYDPKVSDLGWAAIGRESKFTKLMLDMRVNRQKYKDSKGGKSFDSSRTFVSQDKTAELEQLAIYDKLTGLFNSRTFGKKLKYELKRAKRYKRPLSLLIVGVDNLDSIRRQYGSLIIDDTLRACAEIVRQAVRDVDVPARASADKIAVIFPETYSSRAIVVGERIRERIRGQQINDDLRHLRVTASVGVVSFPTHARDENELLNKAVEFLNKASSEGGDRVYND